MNETYDVSDGPSPDFFVSPVIRVADLGLALDDSDASCSNPTSGRESGWMSDGRVEGRIAVGIRQIRNDVGVSAEVADSRVIDVAKVSAFPRDTEGSPRVHSKEFLNSIPEAPPIRIVEAARLFGPDLVETERVACAPVV